jgi:hypothetical protein
MNRRYLRFVTIAIALAFTLISASTATAQVVRTAEIAQKIHTELPEIPIENQYFSRKLNKIDPNNTLINRVLRYHSYVKGRPVQVRLDWKLTLADYLDANDIMDSATYPSQDVLTVNPMEGDRAAMNKLPRETRNRLIDRLIQYTRRSP